MQYEPSPENGAAEWKVESTAAFLVEKKREEDGKSWNNSILKNINMFIT